MAEIPQEITSYKTYMGHRELSRRVHVTGEFKLDLAHRPIWDYSINPETILMRTPLLSHHWLSKPTRSLL